MRYSDLTELWWKSVRNCKDSFYLKLLLNIAIKSASWKYAGVFLQKELVGVYLTKNTNKVSRCEDQPQTLQVLISNGLFSFIASTLFVFSKKTEALPERSLCVQIIALPCIRCVIKLPSQNIK